MCWHHNEVKMNRSGSELTSIIGNGGTDYGNTSTHDRFVMCKSVMHNNSLSSGVDRKEDEEELRETDRRR